MKLEKFIPTSNSFISVSDKIFEVKNPTGFGKRYYNKKEFKHEQVTFRRNKKGASIHLLKIEKVAHGIKLSSKLFNYKRHLRFSSFIFFLFAGCIGSFSNNFYAFTFMMLPSIFLFILSFKSNARTTKWFKEEADLLKSLIQE